MTYLWICPNCHEQTVTTAPVGQAVCPQCPYCTHVMNRRYTPPVIFVKLGPSDIPGSALPESPADIRAWETHSGCKFKK